MTADDVRGACGPGQAKRREENVPMWEGQARGEAAVSRAAGLGWRSSCTDRGGHLLAVLDGRRETRSAGVL